MYSLAQSEQYINIKYYCRYIDMEDQNFRALCARPFILGWLSSPEHKGSLLSHLYFIFTVSNSLKTPFYPMPIPIFIIPYIITYPPQYKMKRPDTGHSALYQVQKGCLFSCNVILSPVSISHNIVHNTDSGWKYSYSWIYICPANYVMLTFSLIRYDMI